MERLTVSPLINYIISGYQRESMFELRRSLKSISPLAQPALRFRDSRTVVSINARGHAGTDTNRIEVDFLLPLLTLVYDVSNGWICRNRYYGKANG